MFCLSIPPGPPPDSVGNACDTMDQSGSDITEFNELVSQSETMLSGLRSRASEANEKQKKHLEQFGSEAIELIEQVSAQVAGELVDQLNLERADFSRQKSEWEKVRDEVERELANREQTLLEKSQQPIDTSEHDSRIASLEQEAESLRQEIQTKSGANHTLRDRCLAVENERDEISHKFDLALEDLQQHRDHVAELEEQLASRPDPAEGDSLELIQLRNERDELLVRLDELSLQSSQENEPADIADLRERFEMAVNEVRELKTVNQELEQKLAAQPTSNLLGEEANDWESQKRRMLAMLDREGESPDEERSQERASIAGTIQITDGVIHEKDQQIAELTEKIESLENQENGTDSSPTDEATSAILDVNEVVRAERERIAELEADWEEKLRSAELELSVERAKIARAQAEITKQQQAIDAFKDIEASHKAAGKDDGKRKWFNKLGLGDDIKE